MKAWGLVLVGLVVVFGAFQALAMLTRSYKGEAGLVIALSVTGLLFVVERVFFHRRPVEAWRLLGLGLPSARSLWVAVLVCVAMLSLLPLYARAADVPLRVVPGFLTLLPGLFAQAGVAEEVLFRGYLFRHFRSSLPFWRAAGASAIPFVAVHLILFLSMPWPVAATATLVAVATSFPLAHLFDMGRGTIWAPALVHFVIQGGIKIVAVDERVLLQLSLFWMLGAVVLPFAAFLFPREFHEREASS